MEVKPEVKRFALYGNPDGYSMTSEDFLGFFDSDEEAIQYGLQRKTTQKFQGLVDRYKLEFRYSEFEFGKEFGQIYSIINCKNWGDPYDEMNPFDEN